ncbi:MAG: hypothetical protein HC896_06440 [Bacteroidales bacterium]|nr:hypothetical protein [Bacteroidales bacterium]
MYDYTLQAQTKDLGVFTYALDTLPPDIVPINILSNTNIQGKTEIRFNVTDKLSGVDVYKGYIDGNWALFEYDPKTGSLVHNLNYTRILKNMQHELELLVSDKKGNVSRKTVTFFY